MSVLNNKTRIVSWILLVLAGSTLIMLAIRLHYQIEKIETAEYKRVQSIVLADELRQSSDDLTRFARLYVQTQDEKFLKYYNTILEIRKGIKPRPLNYEHIYWDFVSAGDTSLLTQNKGDKEALMEKMHKLEFSEHEFNRLKLAETRSNNLTKMEYMAFELSKNIGNKNDIDLARKLLFGEQYLIAKANIMKPIEEFQISVDQRTKQELDKQRSLLKQTQILIIISTLVFLISAFFMQFYQKNEVK